MRIGIFGGTFNPLHNGHLLVAQTALQQADLQQVWLMVSPQNPLKHTAALPFCLRYRLARIALWGNSDILPSAFEASLPTPSYTYHTLLALRKHWPQHTFSLIIGQDNWDNFPRWYRYEDILADTPVIVYPRSAAVGSVAQSPPQSPEGDVQAEKASPRGGLEGAFHPAVGDLQSPTTPKITLQGQFLPVSSTDIRARLHQQQDIQHLTPTILQPILKRLYS